MKRLVIISVIGLIVAPVLAGPEILPINGAGYLNYDMAAGKATPINEHMRYGEPIWSCGLEYVNYFWGASAGETGLDWGDIAGPARIGGFGFSEFTNSQAADGDLQAIIIFYTEEDGENSSDRVYAEGFLIDNVPGSEYPADEYWGYYWKVDLADSFTLDGSDLDGDGLADWGYAQNFSVKTPGAVHGPAVCGLVDPDELPELAPGIEDAYDLFIFDPNTGESNYDGTYSFGGPPLFAQFYFELYAPSCPNRPYWTDFCNAADLDYDCMISLSDLAQLLGYYGCTSGCGRAQGDIEPYDPDSQGDGDVDLADLAMLLAAYGECQEP